jgi:hypothetical protein
MRILHVVSAPVGGGAETLLRMLICDLGRRHQIGVFYLMGAPGLNNRDGIQSILVPRGRI